jgi:xylan 1,4-beta-xylosidase
MSNDFDENTTIQNPVLRGFNPDPSITTFRGDYVIATSTFEWFPGIRLHRSSDLAEWTTTGHALDERIAFDLAGIPDSGGVWAPSITVVDDRLWLAYSVVHTMNGDDLDAKNYLTTSDSLDGPWTEPVFLGSRGFDFSFFHDEGRHWLVGVQWDHRPGRPSFSGIVLEEYLAEEKGMSGDPHVIFRSDGLVEGPNLYRINDTYLLTLAEGGTGWNHGITAAQAPTVLGPYRRDPVAAVLTSRDAPGLPLQKAGHGELVHRPDGALFLAHLAARPVLHEGSRYSTLGRETCIQKVEIDGDGWVRQVAGTHHPQTLVPLHDGSGGLIAPPEARPNGVVDDFDGHLDLTRWSSLRRSPSSFARISSGAGLEVMGGESSSSLFGQSLLAQRVTEHRMRAEAVVDAEPPTSRQSAGLVLWYDTQGWMSLQVTRADGVGRVVQLVTRTGDGTMLVAETEAPSGPVRLRVDLDGAKAVFSVATVGGEAEALGVPQAAWRLSDDFGDRLRFTGLFAGIRADDLDGTGWSAAFRKFSIHHS